MTTATKTRSAAHRPAAIPAHVLAELRERDDAGVAAPLPYAYDMDGAPLRCCLRRSRAGERIALVAYAPLRRWAAETGAEPGAYDETGPVFIHVGRCPGPDADAGYAFADTGAQRVLRRYTAEGRIEGGTLVHLPARPDDAQAVMRHMLVEAFADPAVALVHVRAVEHGCFLYEVRRFSAGGLGG
ncbi:DUF1203 domain-containing protein [Streptomyces boninensis]|uniref:DUF1203 domain-containing protein n=1 Tax=Streptomyces boninensis TaxID=2039455 RepID=UPI003B21B167